MSGRDEFTYVLRVFVYVSHDPNDRSRHTHLRRVTPSECLVNRTGPLSEIFTF